MIEVEGRSRNPLGFADRRGRSFEEPYRVRRSTWKVDQGALEGSPIDVEPRSKTPDGSSATFDCRASRLRGPANSTGGAARVVGRGLPDGPSASCRLRGGLLRRREERELLVPLRRSSLLGAEPADLKRVAGSPSDPAIPRRGRRTSPSLRAPDAHGTPLPSLGGPDRNWLPAAPQEWHPLNVPSRHRIVERFALHPRPLACPPLPSVAWQPRPQQTPFRSTGGALRPCGDAGAFG